MATKTPAPPPPCPVRAAPSFSDFGVDVEREELMTPAEACSHPALRKSKTKPCRVSKIYRLFDPGQRGVRLECVRTPSGLRTSRQAISRFISRLNMTDSSRRPPTSSARRRAQAHVDRELDAAGI